MEKRTTSALNVVTPPAVGNTENPDTLFERHFRELQDAITQRAHQIWEHNGFAPGRDLENWLRAETEIIHFVPLEITDTVDGLHVTAEVPGFNARDIDVHLEPRRVVIRGKNEQTRERTKGHTFYSEREGNEVFRAVNLPMEVDPDNASAVVRDGILDLHLPKAKSGKGTRVQVKAA